MKKTYVLDTNVLIPAPYAPRCFEEHTVVLPLVVLEELDSLKKAEGERGANARMAIRMLEELRLKGAAGRRPSARREKFCPCGPSAGSAGG